jgi:hypothetical protein
MLIIMWIYVYKQGVIPVQYYGEKYFHELTPLMMMIRLVFI